MQTLFKPLFMSHLLMVQWSKQVIWPNLDPRGRKIDSTSDVRSNKVTFPRGFHTGWGNSMVVFNKQFATVRNNKLLHQEGILTIESPDCGLCGWPKVALCFTAQMVSLFIPSFNIVLFSQHHREGSIFIFLGAEREGEGSYDLCFS